MYMPTSFFKYIVEFQLFLAGIWKVGKKAGKIFGIKVKYTPLDYHEENHLI